MNVMITKHNAQKEIGKLIRKKKFRDAITIADRFKVSGITVTKLTAKKVYRLTEKEIRELQYAEAPNPYYKCAGAMKLYLIGEIENKIKSRKNT